MPMAATVMDQLEPLWLLLHHHHQTVAPHLGPFAGDAESWRVIRDLLAESAATGLLRAAFDGDRIIGLASAGIHDVRALPALSDTWRTGARVGELKFLVVAPEVRGRGVGAALMAEVDRMLAEQGVHDLSVGVIAPNEAAIRFYQARDFRPAWLELTKA
jgi:GNAT superfamily N-acetyltransferase